MSKATLTKRLEFCSSHRYHNPKWDDEKNRAVFGACNNVNTHGHNYMLEVRLEGPIEPTTGMIINLYDLKRILNNVLKEFDHKNLNLDTPYFSDRIPTTENLAVTLWELLEKHADLPAPDALRLYEDDTLYAEVTADQMRKHSTTDSPSALIARRYNFSAVHESPHGDTHGHNYEMWVATRGPISRETGQVMSLQTLDHITRTRFLAKYDHHNLSQDQAFANLPVTDSTLAKVAWETLTPYFDAPPLWQVSISQIPGAVAYFPG